MKGTAHTDVPRRPDCSCVHIPQIWLTAASGCLHGPRMTISPGCLPKAGSCALCSLDSPEATERHWLNRTRWVPGRQWTCRAGSGPRATVLHSDMGEPGPPHALLCGSVSGRCPQRECGEEAWSSLHQRAGPAGFSGNGCVRVAPTFNATIRAAAARGPSEGLRPQGNLATAPLAPASWPCPMTVQCTTLTCSRRTVSLWKFRHL